MEKLLNLLKAIDDEIDWMNETRLIDERILTSMKVITMISDLEEQFEIEISAKEIIPENFNSIHAIWEMICRIKG